MITLQGYKELRVLQSLMLRFPFFFFSGLGNVVYKTRGHFHMNSKWISFSLESHAPNNYHFFSHSLAQAHTTVLSYSIASFSFFLRAYDRFSRREIFMIWSTCVAKRKNESIWKIAIHADFWARSPFISTDCAYVKWVLAIFTEKLDRITHERERGEKEREREKRRNTVTSPVFIIREDSRWLRSNSVKGIKNSRLCILVM